MSTYHKLLLAMGVLVWGFIVSCGGTTGSGGDTRTGGGTGGTESSASVEGTVSVPRSTTTNVSLGLSASSSVGKGSSVSGDSSSETSQIIVMKATSDDLSTSGSCVLSTPSGTVLNSSCNYSSGKLETGTCGIDCSKLDSTKQVEAKCTSTDGKVVSTLFDATSCKNGSSVSAGTLDASSTTLHLLTLNSLDSNCTPDNKTEACKSKILSDADLKKMILVLKEQLSLGISAGAIGAADGNQAVYSTSKALRECIANVAGCDFSKMAKELSSGFPESKGFVSGGGSADWSAIGATGPSAAAASYKFFTDSTTASKWCEDATSCQALAKNFGAYGLSDLTVVVEQPENARGLLTKYIDDYKSGVSGAFDKMVQGGKVFGKFLGQFGTSQMLPELIEGSKELLDSLDFTSATSVQQENFAKSCYTQVITADSSEKRKLLKKRAKQLARLIVERPGIYADAAGRSVAGSLYQHFALGGSVSNTAPCTVDAECSDGKVCSSEMRICVALASGRGDGSGFFGVSCNRNADCFSNTCTAGRCVPPSSDVFNLGLKGCGSVCTTTADCSNGATCSGGVCGCTITGKLFAETCEGSEQCAAGLSCISGTCQPTVLASNLTDLAGGLVRNTTELFFIQNRASTTDGKICKIPVAGGSVTCIAENINQPRGMRLIGSTLFFSTTGTTRYIYKVPTGGGSVTKVYQTTVYHPQNGLVNDANSGILIIPRTSASPNGRLASLPVTATGATDASLTVIKSGLDLPRGLHLRGSLVWFSQGSARTTLSKLTYASPENTPPTVATAAAAIQSRNTNDTTACWTEGTAGDGALKCVPINGGSVTTLLSGLTNPDRIGFSGGFAYLTIQGPFDANGNPQGQGSLVKIPITGGVATTLVNNISPSGLRIVGDEIVFLDHLGTIGSIKKAAK